MNNFKNIIQWTAACCNYTVVKELSKTSDYMHHFVAMQNILATLLPSLFVFNTYVTVSVSGNMMFIHFVIDI